jgi:hypothetical protein
VFTEENCKVRGLAVALYDLQLRVERIDAINANIQSKPRLIRVFNPTSDSILTHVSCALEPSLGVHNLKL